MRTSGNSIKHAESSVITVILVLVFAPGLLAQYVARQTNTSGQQYSGQGSLSTQEVRSTHQNPSNQRAVILETDPLSYAALFARRTDNQYALSKIAVFYAELGKFEQAMRIVESVSDEHWQAAALGEIAVHYWKQGYHDKSRQLFLRIAGLPLPKDVIYIWGDIMENMATAQQFELALDIASSMEPSDSSTTGSALEKVLEEFLQARKRDPKLPDVVPRVLAIANTLQEGQSLVLKNVAVYHAARGDFRLAESLVSKFKEDYDQDDAAYEVAVQLAKSGQYDRAVNLADKAGKDYFEPIALIEIAGEAIKRKDKLKALEIAARTDALLMKMMKEADEDVSWVEAQRLSELAIVYSKLDRTRRAIELADLAFKKARQVGKPGDRFSSLRAVISAYKELELYPKAIEASRQLTGDQVGMDTLADLASHALDKGQPSDVARLVSVMLESPLKEHPEMRVKALASVADEMAKRGRVADALKVLKETKEFAESLEENDNERTPESLKSYAVAWARAGDFRTSMEWVGKTGSLYFAAWALIEIGEFAAKSGWNIDENNLQLLDEFVNSDLPPAAEPRRLINAAGWEIPGLAVGRKLRPPELKKTRDRSFELYVTLYEPEVETFIKRPFTSREKPKAEQADWISEGLKIRLIEERVINGRTYCYAITGDEIFHDEAGLPKYGNRLETLLYYDDDGDGQFETLEEGLDFFSLGRIPEWVLKK